MRATITLFFITLNFLIILIHGLNIKDDIGKEEKNQVQVSNFYYCSIVFYLV